MIGMWIKSVVASPSPREHHALTSTYSDLIEGQDAVADDAEIRFLEADPAPYDIVASSEAALRSRVPRSRRNPACDQPPRIVECWRIQQREPELS
jgi:hypothetical protein